MNGVIGKLHLLIFREEHYLLSSVSVSRINLVCASYFYYISNGSRVLIIAMVSAFIWVCFGGLYSL